MQIIALTQRQPSVIEYLTALWQASATATHDFLTAENIAALRPEVEAALVAIEHLAVIINEEGDILGFLGCEGEKLEMLFLAPQARGLGLGKRMIVYAIEELQIKLVDVNEQNQQAVGFYQKLGFEQVGRSALDGQGRAFPLLHLALPESTT